MLAVVAAACIPEPPGDATPPTTSPPTTSPPTTDPPSPTTAPPTTVPPPTTAPPTTTPPPTTSPPTTAPPPTGGPVTAALRASRTDCYAPCSVVFSAEDTVDDGQPGLASTFHDLGYHFDFDDPGSGTFATSGLSRNRQVGGPLAAHTFDCDNGGTCSFEVGVRAQNSAGDFGDDFVTVRVQDPDARFAGARTICVSASGNFGGPDACPAGAVQQTSTPSLGQLDDVRVLYRNGEQFAPFCIDYSAADVLVSTFGDRSAGAPFFPGELQVGVAGRCGDMIPNDAQIGAIDGSTGYPVSWASNITLTGLRPHYVRLGMSYTHVDLNGLDMDFEDTPEGGAVSLASNTEACLSNSNLTCANVPYPVGAYVTDTTLTRSQFELENGLPNGNLYGGVAIGAYNCPVINWTSLLGSTVHRSVGHGWRSEGTWRAFHGHNAMAGYHYRDPATEGVRQKMTVRACGSGEIDPGQARYRHDAEQGTPEAPMTRFTVVADNTFGSLDDFGGGWKMTLSPTTAGSAEVLSYGIVERNTFVEPEDEAYSTTDVNLSGHHLACRDNVHSTPGVRQDCSDRGQNAVPGQWYTPADLDAPSPPQPSAPAR